MSAFCEKRTSTHVPVMSALPPKADIAAYFWDVRVVANKRYRAEQIEQAVRHRGPLGPGANLRLPRVWIRWSWVGFL
jgi:hypothetical protein